MSYCRNIQNGLLPHYGNFAKITGIGCLLLNNSNLINVYINSFLEKEKIICDKKCFNKYCPSHKNSR